MNKSLFSPFRLLLVVVIAGLSAVILWPGLLEKLGLSFHTQWFLDSHAILAANDAARAGADLTQPNALDPLSRAHVYSDWWLGLRWLGLTRADNFAFGGTCCLLFLAVALLGLRPATYGAATLLAFALLAPPTLLALQRANNDLLIFALIGAGLWALRSGNGPLRLAGFGAAVVVATGLKYYPIVAVGALVAILPWRRVTFQAFGLTLAAALAVLASERASVGRGMFILPDTIHQFGASLLWRDLSLARPALAALALLVLTAGAALAWRRGWTAGLADRARGPEGERLMFAVGAFLLVGCFVAGTSYAYRWIFGLWLAPWLWREARAGRMAARAALALWLAAIWADGALCLVVNTLGLSYRPALGWRLITQPFSWLLMVLVAGWLLEAIAAQARAWVAGRESGSAPASTG